VSSVLRPRQHSIDYTGDGYYRSKHQPTVSMYWRRCYKREKNENNKIHI